MTRKRKKRQNVSCETHYHFLGHRCPINFSSSYNKVIKAAGRDNNGYIIYLTFKKRFDEVPRREPHGIDLILDLNLDVAFQWEHTGKEQ